MDAGRKGTAPIIVVVLTAADHGESLYVQRGGKAVCQRAFSRAGFAVEQQVDGLLAGVGQKSAHMFQHLRIVRKVRQIKRFTLEYAEKFLTVRQAVVPPQLGDIIVETE